MIFSRKPGNCTISRKTFILLLLLVIKWSNLVDVILGNVGSDELTLQIDLCILSFQKGKVSGSYVTLPQMAFNKIRLTISLPLSSIHSEDLRLKK